jgi:adenylate cyclase, class 2
MAGGCVSEAVREIEVKYRLDDAGAIEEVLRNRGAVLSAPVHQDDQAYAERDWSYGQSKIGVTFARLRTQGGQHLFTVKTPIDNEMACLEHETVVADRDQMHCAILAMGFRPTVRIVKTRRKAALGGVSVCVDDVQHAGLFFEIEKVVRPGASALAVQAELDGLARSLGLGLAMQRVTDTYDSLVREALAGS